MILWVMGVCGFLLGLGCGFGDGIPVLVVVWVVDLL